MPNLSVGKQYPSLTVGNVNMEVVIPEGLVPDNQTATFSKHLIIENDLVFIFQLGVSNAKFHYGYGGDMARLILKVPKQLRVRFGRSRIRWEVEATRLIIKVSPMDRKQLITVNRKKADPTPTPRKPVITPARSFTNATLSPPKSIPNLPAPTSLEHTQLKLLVQELNRRTREDDNITMEVTKEGTLRILVEYQ